VEQKEKLASHITEIAFLQDHEMLRTLCPLQEMPFKWRDHLKHLLLTLKHESTDVRVHALDMLHTLLQTNKVYIF
jgi:hypothetical protein